MGLVLATLSAFAPPPATTQTETVRVAFNPYMSYAPLFIAQQEGYFAQQDLEIELVELRTSSLWLAPLIRGQIDVGVGPVTPGLLNAIARGARLRIVAGKEFYDPSSDCTYQGIVVSRALASKGEHGDAALLGGKRVSVDRASVYEYFLYNIMHAAGLDVEQVDLRPLPSAAELEALLSGQIDAFNCGEPWLRRALDSNQAVLRFSAKEVLPDFQPGLLAFGPTLLDDRPGIGQRFLTAYLAGARSYSEGKTPRNLDHLEGFQGLDRGLLTRICWPSIDITGQLNIEELNRFQGWLLGRGLLDRELSADDYFEPSFLANASNTQGVSR